MPPRSDGTTTEDPSELNESFDDDESLYTPEDGEQPGTDVEDVDDVEGDEDSPAADDGVTESQVVAQLKGQIKELNSRIGSLAQANDQRLKEVQGQWQTWGENYRKWAEEQIGEARRLGREEAEERLLTQLDPESKAEYFEETRSQEKQRRANEERLRREAAEQMQSQAREVSSAVQAALNQGVPIEKIDQSSPAAVTNSVAAYFRSQGSTPAEPVNDVGALQREVADLKEQLTRVKRDSSGASRTGTSVGGQPRVNSKLKEIDEAIVQAKRRHSVTDVLRLKREREALLTGR